MCPPREAPRWIRTQDCVHYIGFFIQPNSLNFYYQTLMLCTNDIIMNVLSWAYYFHSVYYTLFNILFYSSANVIHDLTITLPFR